MDEPALRRLLPAWPGAAASIDRDDVLLFRVAGRMARAPRPARRARPRRWEPAG